MDQIVFVCLRYLMALFIHYSRPGRQAVLHVAAVRPFRLTQAIARDRVSTRANLITQAYHRSHKMVNCVKYRSGFLGGENLHVKQVSPVVKNL